MVRITQHTTRLAFLCILWVLTRSLQFVFEVTKLQEEADGVSDATLSLEVKVEGQLESLLPWVKRQAEY